MSGQVYALQFTRKSATRSVSTEMTLHSKACAASDRVLKLHHRGSSSAQAYFAITEHCASNLRSRIVVGEGVPDDDLSDTDGFELLARCTEPTSTNPWVRVTKTKRGKKISNSQRLEELTSFLRSRAGLA